MKKDEFTRVVAGVFHRQSAGCAEVAVFRRASNGSGAGFYEFPGGKVEGQETDHQALLREIKEELGVDVRIEKLVGENSHEYPKRNVLLIMYLITQICNRSFQLSDHDDWKWVSQKDIPKIKLSAADVPLVSTVFEMLLSQTGN